MAGRVIGISGPTVITDLGGLALYDLVTVGRHGLQGEVVRLERQGAVVQVYEETRGVRIGEAVTGLGRPLSVKLGPGLLGKIFDGLQRPLEAIRRESGPYIRPGALLPALEKDRVWRFEPEVEIGSRVRRHQRLGSFSEGAFRHHIHATAEGVVREISQEVAGFDQPLVVLDTGQRLKAFEDWSIRAPRPFVRKLSPDSPLVTGQRCIDFLFPIARGGSAILPGGFGTGKTILEQAIAKYADIDLVVYVGCGERGNEMAELLEEFSALTDPWNDRRLMERTIMVANTSNMPVAAREASIYTAVTMAEYYRDMGYHVLLLADSISRWAEALREISSALEEMPGEEGYPTYLASRLAGFFARAGVVETASGGIGSLSMIISVSPPGGDFTEPVTQACLRACGTFLMLDAALAHRRHFPAINWQQSFSLYEKKSTRFFQDSVSGEWPRLQGRCRVLLQEEEKLREVAEIVGAEGLQEEDHLLMEVAERIRTTFLSQNSYTEDAFSTPAHTAGLIETIVSDYDATLEKLGSGPANPVQP